jgi:Na+-translocating ferredoxin:NAD+ oxidoreductase subunit D
LKLTFNKQKESAFSVVPVDTAMQTYRLVLYVISVIYILYNFVLNINYGIQACMIFALSIFVAREIEILFYSHFKKATRVDALDALKQTYPEITAILVALIIPIGTSITVVAIAILFTAFIVKLSFGGFSYNVFNPAIAALLFATASFPSLVSHNLKNPFIGTSDHSLPVFFSMDNLIISSIVLTICLAFLIYKKIINYIIPVSILVCMLTTITAISLMSKISFLEIFSVTVTGYTLFGIVLLANDPITSPLTKKGKIIYGVIIGIVSVYITLKSSSQEGIFTGILFANIITPYLNAKSKDSKYTLSILLSLVFIILISFYITINFF